MLKNNLADEKGLYLKQHQQDPVHWHIWGAQAFKKAKKENKPILLSVGYSACHWCHVMAQESFRDPQTAELMNRFFINIKVDKEERPDVDSLYQEALHLFNKQSGWPLTMFLTPEGKPFFGGTYFPPEQKQDVPSFREVLWQLANLWRRDHKTILEKSVEVYDGLKFLATSQSGVQSIPQEKIDELVTDILPFLDADNGGFGHGAKFPQVVPLRAMWQVWRHGKEPQKERRVLAAGVRLTLDSICTRGLYDHLGGGFYRYSVDPHWHMPHFEKMLTDNALLIELLTDVWCETKTPLYADRIKKTVEWVLKEMVLKGGGFASALNADTPKGEGQFYLWTPAEIREYLGEKADDFMVFYSVDPLKDTPQHLWIANTKSLQADADAMVLHAQTLAAKREERTPPTRDNKCLTDANGYMIAALARVSKVFGCPEWLEVAQKAYGFICENLSRADGGLSHSWCDGVVKPTSFAEDYASMAHAALVLHEVTGDKAFLTQAEKWAFCLMEHHQDAQKGGFYKTEEGDYNLFMRLKSSRDGGTPSANGLMMHVFAKLYHFTKNPLWQQQAEHLFGAFDGNVRQEIFAYTSFLLGQSLLLDVVDILLVGKEKNEAFQGLEAVAWQAPVMNKTVTCVMETTLKSLNPRHLAYGKKQIDGQPTAYICYKNTCLAPITSADALKDTLHTLGS